MDILTSLKARNLIIVSVFREWWLWPGNIETNILAISGLCGITGKPEAGMR
ncbi:MAG: hypothetical protein MK098_12990 [Marinovum sp.]|nr:hypothetical protein [Marinovum sp.]